MSKRNWTLEQSELLEFLDGHTPKFSRVAVLADAGSGKTSVLVERVRRFPVVDFGRILCISFTEKSASDLSERLSVFSHVDVATIHGFCGRIVKEFGSFLGLTPALRIMDESETSEIFTEAFEKTYRLTPPVSEEHSVDAMKSLSLIARAAKHARGQYFCQFSSPELMPVSLFVERVLAEFEQLKLKRKGIEYNDLEQMASKLLIRPEVQSVLQRRYNHVFVDEFQDTSDLQCRLVLHLSGEKNPLFVVGDTKQSIYRFRGADVKVFEKFVQGLPFQKRLSSNFRSHPEVIAAINSVCTPVIEKYEPMEARRLESQTFPEGLLRVARIQAEDDASGVSSIVKHLQTKGVPLSDIVILLPRMKGKAKERLVLGLSKLGVELAAVSSDHLQTSKEFQSLFNLWIWACEPWQTLRAVQVVTDFVPTDRAKLFDAVKMLPIVFSPGDWMSAELLLRKLNEAFHLFSRFGNVYEQFSILIQSLQSKGLSPHQISARFDRGAVSELSALSPPGNLSNTIRAMTVHGSKGLEFPVVILADLDGRVTRSRSVFYERGEEEHKIWLLGYLEDGSLDKTHPQLKEALSREAEQERAENARLLYVAMTRAQEALYVVDRPLKEKEKPKENWRYWLRNGIPHAISAESLAGQSEDVIEAGGKVRADTPNVRVNSKDVLYHSSRIGVTELAKDREFEGGGKGGIKRSRAIELGVEIHSCLEFENWERLREVASRENLDLSLFFDWLQTDIGKRVFGSEGKVFNEFPFEWKNNGRIVTGRVDKLLVLEKEVWIIDYKISLTPRDKKDLISAYFPQLQIYKNAISDLSPDSHIKGFILDVVSATGEIFLAVQLD